MRATVVVSRCDFYADFFPPATVTSRSPGGIDRVHCWIMTESRMRCYFDLTVSRIMSVVEVGDESRSGKRPSTSTSRHAKDAITTSRFKSKVTFRSFRKFTLRGVQSAGFNRRSWNYVQNTPSANNYYLYNRWFIVRTNNCSWSLIQNWIFGRRLFYSPCKTRKLRYT